MQQCDDCLGLKVTSVFAGFGSFCAPCAGKRACRPGGLPPPPGPPPPVTITGPDGTARQLAFRVWRCHNGVVVDLREVGVQGFSFSTISAIGRHDQPIDAQVQHLIVEARETIGTVHLDRPRPDAPLMLAGNEVTGELVWPDHSYPYGRYPYDVVVDGKQMSWQEFGLTLEPFEGLPLPPGRAAELHGGPRRRHHRTGIGKPSSRPGSYCRHRSGLCSHGQGRHRPADVGPDRRSAQRSTTRCLTWSRKAKRGTGCGWTTKD